MQHSAVINMCSTIFQYVGSFSQVRTVFQLFASGLSQNGKSEEDGIMGFLPADIMKEVRRAMRLVSCSSQMVIGRNSIWCNDYLKNF